MTWFPETITLEFGKPQTELERARAHMRACQEDLRRARINLRGEFHRPLVCRCEDRFLASLSWLWDAQERAGWKAPTVAWPTLPDGHLEAWRYAVNTLGVEGVMLP